VHYTPGGLENFVGMQTKNPSGLDHVMYRLDNTKMLEIMFCPPCPVGVRSDEGDATAEAESIALDCSGPGNHFVFLCNFIGRSNQLNSPPMT